ncbi:hypothetical protein H4S14_003486 [Agrobacterium vitis]|nr:hypothetical protein [Agrobacterium vitis]MBE1439721.1 hypothetical protein [Agrobacterium vitis]
MAMAFFGFLAMDEIGERIKEAAEKVGGLNQLSQLIGIPRRTLGNQITGKGTKASLLVDVSKVTGVSIHWLATGEGQKEFELQAKIEVDAELMERLHDRVASIFHDVGQKPPQRRIAREAANLYNELAKVVQDMSDAEMVDAALPMVTLEFKRKLDRAAAEPGTGKRSAS